MVRNDGQDLECDKKVVLVHEGYHGYEIIDSPGGKMADFQNTI